ncbi:hypothetical protein [Lacinutrix sp. Bg11-31]|uniref:hypothetical protein n=1 Tax=Lacinutrix sp. Bg11-31 TaxID=2057808 RepID=UPI000C30BACD|nr:hypothetical protein [Lacinutrix sp. Bg11-31]AUC81925.1 hypothetical protein CW733_07195 [Lacinutrix sp. Bg11-31]
MQKFGFVLVFVFFFLSCKKQKEEQLQHVEVPVKAKTENTIPEKTHDFSSIPKDTIFVTGKYIIFTRPSDKEFEILKEEEGINEVDSDFGVYSSKVVDSLQSTYKITTTSKRIIGIVKPNDTIYIDRLSPKARVSRDPIHYSAFLVFNDYFSIYSNVYTDGAYYGFIRDYYNTVRFEKPIANKYVISRNGLNIRQENGTVDGKYNNGDLVNIIGYTDEVIEVEDEGKIIKGRWAIVQWRDGGTTLKRYVFEGFLGNLEDVIIYEDQICVGSKLSEATRYNIKEADIECLTEYLDFEVISKASFNALKSIKNEFSTINPAVLIKDNEDKTQDITLPIKDSVIVYKSKVGYSNATHGYYGDIDFLNQYLMHHVYPKAEDAFFSFVDRSTGKETYSFADYPYVSLDKKKIVSFTFDVYEEQFFIEIYKINQDKSIVLENAFYFVHWLKTHQNEVKWISNTEFAIEIVNQNIWNGSAIKNPQYLKIKLKE